LNYRFQFDEASFLAHHWQRTPLLIKQALPGFKSPLAPDELAGLSMEAEVQSRIISVRDQQWRLETGPFTAQDFQRNDEWTLLVQQVDQLLPKVEALKRCARFLPTWRFDDIMVSYAVDGGGVGPHFDRYDVFLLQGLGTRRWYLGDFCDDKTPRLEHESLHLLQSFSAQQEYLLEPGDVLYVPPGLAHWGVAEGECMTYSLGFRAPRIHDLLARMTDAVIDRLAPDVLLEDAGVAHDGAAGEVTQAHIANAKAAVINAINALDDGYWLAEVTSQTGALGASDPTIILLPGDVRLRPDRSMTWIRHDHQLALYIADESLLVSYEAHALTAALCAGEAVSQQPTSAPEQQVIDFLSAGNHLVNDD